MAVTLLRPHTRRSRFTPDFLPAALILWLGCRIKCSVDNYLTPNNWVTAEVLCIVLQPLPRCSAGALECACWEATAWLYLFLNGIYTHVHTSSMRYVLTQSQTDVIMKIQY